MLMRSANVIMSAGCRRYVNCVQSKMKLILASSSPRRAEVLRDAGIAFEACGVQIDETRRPGESARTMVARLAEAKARAGARQVVLSGEGRIIIGADTVV